MSVKPTDPAFPGKGLKPDDDGINRPHDFSGITLRQYYAAKAMQGAATKKYSYFDPKEAARWAFIIADCMIEHEQEEKKEEES